MNLALHGGWLGLLEAAAIAFAIGFVACVFWHLLARRLRWPEGRAFGWAGLSAVAIGAGIDLWHLLRLFFVNPGSPARVQLALAGIHDPGRLGIRAILEILAALSGVVLAWAVLEARKARKAP